RLYHPGCIGTGESAASGRPMRCAINRAQEAPWMGRTDGSTGGVVPTSGEHPWQRWETRSGSGYGACNEYHRACRHSPLMLAALMIGVQRPISLFTKPRVAADPVLPSPEY